MDTTKDLGDVVRKALQDNLCPNHHFGFRFDPHFELFCHRCKLSFIITPDIKEAIDRFYSFASTPYETTHIVFGNTEQ